jgi:cyclophilin family peptidyl-prolyl cis-trans isomerase
MSIHPDDQVRENLFDKYYYPYKAQIWAVSAIILFGAIGWLWMREHRRSRLDDQWDRYNRALEMRPGTLPGQADPNVVREQVEVLRNIVRDYPEDPVTPFALSGIVDAHIAAGEHEQALTTLSELRDGFRDFALNHLPSTTGEEGPPRSLADHLQQALTSERDWDAATKYVHTWPSEDRLALVETTAGSFWIGFYEDASPDHVAAFVGRAKSGAYNGTQIYEVRQNTDGSPLLFRGGSAASSSERDPALHDRDEPRDTIEPEQGRFSLRHVYRTVSAVEMESGESATRFMVITAPKGMTRYDGQNTIFGAVIDREGSLETIDRIARAQTYSSNPETTTSEGVVRVQDHPYPPIHVRRVSIWFEEKKEDGHEWPDGALERAGTSEPEPWEADLPPAPKPEEFVNREEREPDDTPDDGAEDEGDDGPGDEPVDKPAPEDAPPDEGGR